MPKRTGRVHKPTNGGGSQDIPATISSGRAISLWLLINIGWRGVVLSGHPKTIGFGPNKT